MSGLLVWLTGRPAAGKSTLAAEVTRILRARGHDVLWLDSDAMRAHLASDLGFDDHDRDAFYSRLSDVAVEATARHDAVVVSATAPRARYRDAARRRVARFVEVLVTASDATLEGRDPKGLYAAARAGTARHVPGAGAVYEPPVVPTLVCDTDHATVGELAARIIDAVQLDVDG